MRNCVFEFQLRYNMYIQGTNEHDNVMVLFEFSQTQQVGNTDSRLHYQHAYIIEMILMKYTTILCKTTADEHTFHIQTRDR